MSLCSKMSAIKNEAHNMSSLVDSKSSPSPTLVPYRTRGYLLFIYLLFLKRLWWSRFPQMQKWKKKQPKTYCKSVLDLQLCVCLHLCMSWWNLIFQCGVLQGPCSCEDSSTLLPGTCYWRETPLNGGKPHKEGALQVSWVCNGQGMLFSLATIMMEVYILYNYKSVLRWFHMRKQLWVIGM